MNPLALALLATAHWTNPRFAVDTLGCASVDSAAAVQLDTAQLWGWPRYWDGPPELLASKDVRGREGRPDSLSFVDGGQLWTVYIVTKDVAGNPSCNSNMAQVNGGQVGVGPQIAALELEVQCPPASDHVRLWWIAPAGVPVEVSLFDIAGRLIARTVVDKGGVGRWEWPCASTGQGWYFARLTSGRHSIVERFAVIR